METKLKKIPISGYERQVLLSLKGLFSIHKQGKYKRPLLSHVKAQESLISKGLIKLDKDNLPVIKDVELVNFLLS